MARLLKKKVVWILALVLAAAAIGGGIAARASRKPPQAEGDKASTVTEFAANDVVQLEPFELRPQLRVSGSLQPVRQTVVKAKVMGEVSQIRVREGEAVSAGQVLAQFNTADLEARLAEKIGNLESGRAQLALAEKNRSNNQALLKQGFISQNAYDNAVSASDSNRGTLQAWEAQVQLARNALRDATVVAPISGIVSKRHVQAGEHVGVEGPLFSVVDLGELELQAPVPAADVPMLKPGMAVALHVDGFAGETFSGRVGRINPATEAGTRSILVYVNLSNPGHRLKAGMFATGEIALAATRPVPTLPLTALRSEGGQDFAWVIADNKLTRRSVETGGRDEGRGRVEIVKGIAPQAWVLAGRFDNLKEGQSAIVKPAAAAAQGS